MAESKKVVRTKAFKVVMSKGDPIRIDEDEVDKVIEGCAKGNLIMVRQGLINPSYLVNVVADGERIAEWQRECQYGHGQGDAIKERGIKQIGSIFGNTQAGKAIAERDQKLLE